jgi:hypothetical protein
MPKNLLFHSHFSYQIYYYHDIFTSPQPFYAVLVMFVFWMLNICPCRKICYSTGISLIKYTIIMTFSLRSKHTHLPILDILLIYLTNLTNSLLRVMCDTSICCILLYWMTRSLTFVVFGYLVYYVWVTYIYLFTFICTYWRTWFSFSGQDVMVESTCMVCWNKLPSPFH